jgi:hypothetical protein
VNSVTEQLTGTLSLGAAVFASVLFASGMPMEFDVVRLGLGWCRFVGSYAMSNRSVVDLSEGGHGVWAQSTWCRTTA